MLPPAEKTGAPIEFHTSDVASAVLPFRPPARSTLPVVSSVAECSTRAPLMLAENENVGLAGLNSSADDRPTPLAPPVIRTRPLGSSVAGAPIRAAPRLPV